LLNSRSSSTRSTSVSFSRWIFMCTDPTGSYPHTAIHPCQGTSLTTTEVPGVEAIRAGVEAVMRDPAYRRNARRLAREFRADTPAHAADIVDAFVTRQLARAA
jgi:hypothetical protein